MGSHTHQLWQKGFPVGPSSGLNLGAALAYAETTKSDAVIVTAKKGHSTDPLADAGALVPVLTQLVSQALLFTVSRQYSYEVAPVLAPHDRVSDVAWLVAALAGAVLLNAPGGATTARRRPCCAPA